jgi:hypothetical protein
LPEEYWVQFEEYWVGADGVDTLTRWQLYRGVIKPPDKQPVYKEPKGKSKGTHASGKAKDEKNEMLHDGQPVAWNWEAIREQSQREEELEEQERNMDLENDDSDDEIHTDRDDDDCSDELHN